MCVTVEMTGDVFYGLIRLQRKKQRTLLKIIHRNVVKSGFVMRSIFSQAALYRHWAMHKKD